MLPPHRVATAPVLNRVPRKQARKDALRLIDTVGFDRALADRYPSQLSGGQQQRVGVARGLAADPNILLMHEPFGAVDPIVRAELQTELIRLQLEVDKTVPFVSHDIDEAFLLGNQVVILEAGGRIAQVGSPIEILSAPATESVATFIGADRRKRALSIRRTPTGDRLVDGEGRAAGVLVGESGLIGDSGGATR